MGKKILIVDDETDLVELVKMRLEASGYDVITAYDGVAGLKKAREGKPDLIVLDILLPEMNGYRVCLDLKTDKMYKDIPIIMFTAKFQPADIRFGKELGADAYITKPFEPQLLIDEIRRLLKD